MVAGKIWSGNGYQRENQTNIGWAGNRLTDSGISSGDRAVPWLPRLLRILLDRIFLMRTFYRLRPLGTHELTPHCPKVSRRCSPCTELQLFRCTYVLPSLLNIYPDPIWVLMEISQTTATTLFPPRVFQPHRQIKHRLRRQVIHPIRHKVPMPLKLKLVIGLRGSQ